MASDKQEAPSNSTQNNTHNTQNTNQTRTIKSTIPSIQTNNKIGGTFTPTPNPSFLQQRLQIWNNIKNKQKPPGESKEITIKVGNVEYKGLSYQTTPISIAKQVGNAKTAVVAKVFYSDDTNINKLDDYTLDEDNVNTQTHIDTQNEGILWDLTRPLEGDCTVDFMTFDDQEGKTVFWHSSAHILGEALENLFGAHLTVGPPLTSGFYYDSYMGDSNLSTEDIEKVEKEFKRLMKENQTFERLICSKEDLLELFQNNIFKQNLIQTKIPDGSYSTCYRSGTLIDLCRGPHIPSTSKIAAMSLTKHSTAYWLGNSELDSLQRVYGITFPDKESHKEYLKLMAEAKARDHRTLGNSLNLFFFEPQFSPGSSFWLPYGARLYNKLCDFMRKEYRIRGFQEVISPNMYNSDLWKISGHWQNYADDMFTFEIEKKGWGLKPMNCPGHCLMFKHMSPSYRQLPLRLADFGVLHRNEASGSLSGLTRVRRFQQDDAHIFCAENQVISEVLGALDFMFYVYDLLGFKYELMLSTRPDNSIGSIQLWDSAEEQLKEALNKSKLPWKENPGDGAFYGPKIDVLLYDAMKRAHQCGTIQLDFQLPIRFDLQYQNQEAGSIDASSSFSSSSKPGGVHTQSVVNVKAQQQLNPQHATQTHAGAMTNTQGKTQQQQLNTTQQNAATQTNTQTQNNAQEISTQYSCCGHHQTQSYQFSNQHNTNNSHHNNDNNNNTNDNHNNHHSNDNNNNNTTHNKDANTSTDDAVRAGMDRPVMIHRAILGSLERMCAVLIEHTAGKFPFWLNPRQAIVLPINGRNNKYGEWVYTNLKNHGFDVGIDQSNNTINKKIRTAQLQQWNYLLVVGDKEQSETTITVRDRALPDKQQYTNIQQLIQQFNDLNKPNSAPEQTIIPWNNEEDN